MSTEIESVQKYKKRTVASDFMYVRLIKMFVTKNLLKLFLCSVSLDEFCRCCRLPCLWSCLYFKFSARAESTALLLAIPELRRVLGRVSNFNQLINWHHHMKGHVQSCHLTKFNAFGVNGEEVIGHWNMVNIHTNVCNLETAFQQPYKFLKCLISFVITVKCYHSVTIWKKLRRKARMLARF